MTVRSVSGPDSLKVRPTKFEMGKGNPLSGGFGKASFKNHKGCIFAIAFYEFNRDFYPSPVHNHRTLFGDYVLGHSLLPLVADRDGAQI